MDFMVKLVSGLTAKKMMSMSCPVTITIPTSYYNREVNYHTLCYLVQCIYIYADLHKYIFIFVVCKAGFTEVDNMVVDVLKYGLYYPAPSNLVVISKYIKEETELLGVLQDLKSLSFNILVSSLDEKDDGSVSFPGFDDYQITSVPNKRMKFAPEPNIGVFWNLDYSPEIISRNGIYHNVKSALANQGHHGKVCVWAYCDDDDDDLLLPNITMVPTGEL